MPRYGTRNYWLTAVGGWAVGVVVFGLAFGEWIRSGVTIGAALVISILLERVGGGRFGSPRWGSKNPDDYL